MDENKISQDFAVKLDALEKLSERTTLLPPWLFRHEELFKSLESARRLEQKSIINTINYIHFSDDHVFALLQHHVYKESILLKANPEPCVDATAMFKWAEINSLGLKLNNFIFQYLIMFDGQSIIMAPAKLINIDNHGLQVEIAETGYAVGQRQAKRYRSEGVEAELNQSGFVFKGELIDFNPLGFKLRISSEHSKNFSLFNPDQQIMVNLKKDGNIIFSGNCRIMRQTNILEHEEIVLSVIDQSISRFRKKPIRNPRRQFVPAPTVSFKHPLLKKKIQREVNDISNLGLSVFEPDQDSVLLAGLIIPELTINFHGLSQPIIKCMGQVIYRQEDHERGILCGIAIIDMDIETHSRLTHIISVYTEPHTRISQEVDMDELWKFFFDTGFMYPEKYNHIHVNRQQFKDVYEKLYKNASDIARHFTYEKNGQIYAHISMLKAYTKTWVLHHHAAKSLESSYTGLKVLKQLIHYLNGFSRLPAANTDYAMGYYRPQNEFPDRVFGDFARELDNIQGCSLDLFSYLTYPTKINHVPFPDGWSISEITPLDLWELERFYNHRSGGLLLKAIGLQSGRMVDEALEKRYEDVGFMRKCKAHSLAYQGELNAVLISEQSSPGLNLSELLNGIKVIVIRPDYLSWDILARAVSKLAKDFSYPEIPLLIYPAEYTNDNNISYEKQYQMCIINLRDNENDYNEYVSKRFRLRLK